MNSKIRSALTLLFAATLSAAATDCTNSAPPQAERPPPPPKPACAPKRCADLRAACGPVPDECGGTLDCGRCDSTFQACVANRCECGAVPGLVASPFGSVGCPGRRVLSPDKRLYLEELEPCHEGHFVARESERDLLVTRWDLNVANDLRAAAWNDQSHELALMYHFSHSSIVFVLEVGKSAPVAKVIGREFYHFERWNPIDDGSLLVAETCGGPLEKLIPVAL